MRLVIDKNTDFKIANKTITFDKNRIPLNMIDMLIFISEAKISTKDIITLTSNEITILISNKGKNFAFINGYKAKNSELKKQQYKALEYKKELATWILMQKFENSKNTLNKLGLDIEIPTIDKNLLGIEGSFARKYFSLYFSLFKIPISKGKRTKQPPLDPLNAMMSYLYSIVYYEITKLLLQNGFEPTISYLHEPFREHFALSSDLLEIFRGDIDYFVAKLFLDKKLNARDFTNQNGIYLRTESRRKIWIEINQFINTLKIQTTISDLKTQIKKHLS